MIIIIRFLLGLCIHKYITKSVKEVEIFSSKLKTPYPIGIKYIYELECSKCSKHKCLVDIIKFNF